MIFAFREIEVKFQLSNVVSIITHFVEHPRQSYGEMLLYSSCVQTKLRRRNLSFTSESFLTVVAIPDDERTQSLYYLKLSNYFPSTFSPCTKTVPSEVRGHGFPHYRKVIHKMSCSTQRLRGCPQLLRPPPTHDAHSRSTPSHLSSIYGTT